MSTHVSFLKQVEKHTHFDEFHHVINGMLWGQRIRKVKRRTSKTFSFLTRMYVYLSKFKLCSRPVNVMIILFDSLSWATV